MEHPDKPLIWNEEIHTFVQSGFDRYLHYSRLIAVFRMGKVVKSESIDDRPSEPYYMTAAEVEDWKKNHSPPPIDAEFVRNMIEIWETGIVGPEDNPKEIKS